VKRGLFAVLLVLGLVSAASPAALAEPAPPAAQRQQVPKPHPAPTAKKPLLRAGVRIAGVRVGRMSPAAAARAVQKGFANALVVTLNRTRFRLAPGKLATPYIDGAIGRAKAAASGTNVHLVVSVHGAAVRAAVAKLARRVDRRPLATQVQLRNGRPYVSPYAFGRKLDQQAVVAKIVHQLTANERRPMHFETETVEPRYLAGARAAVIVIDRGSNLLRVYKGAQVWRAFHVATGQAAYPTPQGRFQIVVKYRNPTWYPPTYDSWAQGLSPVPPGPSNPLGTRWMGLSASGVGIHGTNNPASIGYSVSHGCIRMQVPDSEWLFDHVDIGTTVFIV
jgi:lipoprotein-anchoring transpeptidase ErfK/SrfK